MTLSSSVKFLSPEEIASRSVGDAARLQLADSASVFRDRALRLRQLAAGHAMRDFLIFMADVADAQQAVLNDARSVVLPTRESLEKAAHEGVAPLGFLNGALSDDWQADLNALLQLLQQRIQGAALDVVRSLQAITPEELNQQAQKLMAGVMFGLDMAKAPLIGAALQVHWTRLVAQTLQAYPDIRFDPVADTDVCPCCGSEPVASIAKIGAETSGVRYLHCNLCQSDWHMVRIKCTHCGSTKNITYEELEPLEGANLPTHATPKGAVRAECCGECGHYLKIVDMAKDPHVDPVADDLASVALDLLVTDTGLQRHGVNYLLLWGEPAEGVS